MLRKINKTIFINTILFAILLATSFMMFLPIANASHQECTGSQEEVANCIEWKKQVEINACNNAPASARNTCRREVNDHYAVAIDQGGGTSGNYSEECKAAQLNKDNCGIIAYLATFITVLSALVGIVVTIMIVWGGIMYASSRDNPQQTAAAKGHIVNALIALVSYLFLVAILNWLVPGGVF